MLPCETTVIIVTWFLTLFNVVVWWHYLYFLHRDMNQWKYIDNNRIHSHRHFWIVWVLMTISLLMFYNTFWSEAIWDTFIEHLLYNLACIFVVYPHLQEEK